MNSFFGLPLNHADALDNIGLMIEMGMLLSSSTDSELNEAAEVILCFARKYSSATKQSASTADPTKYPLPVESPTSFESIPAFLRTPQPYPEPQSAGGEGIAQRYYIAEDLNEWENETGLWTIYRQDQDGLTTAMMSFNSLAAAEEALAELKAEEQQPASTATLAIDEPLPNWGATIKVARQQIAPTSFAAIIERIRSRRVALGLTTEELSTRLGFEIDTVEDWETGCDIPELTILLPLSRALFCEPEWLLTGSLEGMTRINEAPLSPVKVMQGVDMAGVGERIRDARVSRRMTHKELEEAAGLPDGEISVWESRKAYPPDEAFDKLAKALNTSVTWLLTGREIARES